MLHVSQHAPVLCDGGRGRVSGGGRGSLLRSPAPAGSLLLCARWTARAARQHPSSSCCHWRQAPVSSPPFRRPHPPSSACLYVSPAAGQQGRSTQRLLLVLLLLRQRAQRLQGVPSATLRIVQESLFVVIASPQSPHGPSHAEPRTPQIPVLS